MKHGTCNRPALSSVLGKNIQNFGYGRVKKQIAEKRNTFRNSKTLTLPFL